MILLSVLLPWWFLVVDLDLQRLPTGMMTVGTEPEARGPYDDLQTCEGMAAVLWVHSGFRVMPVEFPGGLCIPSEHPPARLGERR